MIRKRVPIIATIFGLCALAFACSGGGGEAQVFSGGAGTTQIEDPSVQSDATKQILALEASGKLPKLDRSASLAGPDSDGNGIRDDIDAYITSRNFSLSEKSSAQKVAAAFQLAVTVNTEDGPSVARTESALDMAASCLISTFNGQTGDKDSLAILDSFERLSTNTKERLLNYLKYNQKLDGTGGSLRVKCEY